MVRELLAHIENGPKSCEGNEERLALLLDELAWCSHFVEYEFDAGGNKEPPASNYKALREMVEERFPDLGYYNVAEQVTSNIALANCLVRDAVDDLADITGDLMSVEWRWGHSSEADALWHFQFTYGNHWHEHLRGMQFSWRQEEREDFQSGRTTHFSRRRFTFASVD